jgi:outer membrane protein TolC
MKAKRFIPNGIYRMIVSAYGLLLFFLLPCPQAIGQTSTQQLTLSKALETAAANYGQIRAKDLYAKAQEENIRQVKRQYMPALILHGQVDYATANSVPGSYFSFGFSTSGSVAGSNNYTPVYGAIGMAAIQWIPFSFGQYKAKLEESDLQFRLAGADAEQEAFYNKIYVAQAYLDVLVAGRLKDLQVKNLNRTIVLGHVISQNAKNGLKPGVDTSFANSEIARAQLNVLDAEKNEAEQRNRLATLMGIENSDSQLDTSTFFRRTPVVVLSPSADVSANPVIKIYTTRQNLSAIRETEIYRNYFPKIAVLGVTDGRGSGISYNGHYDESFAGGTQLTRFNYGVGLSCTFNILDYPRMKAEQITQKFRTDAAKTELEEQTLGLKNELILANNKLRISLEQVRQTPVQYTAALDFYRQKLAMYTTGLANIVDLSQALYNLNRAEADNAIARDAVWKALLLKASVSGDFNLFINSANTK